MNNLRLMAIFAHPDDEAFGNGGSLSKYNHEGVEVHLVTATLGEAGDIANPDIVLTDPISVVREQELRCACATYGNITLHLLGYVDGQTAIAPLREAVFKIVKLIRQIQPQVVITFGPDGAYGHFDHLVVHRWTHAAIRLAAEADTWPQAGAPYQVAKLYHRVLPQGQVDLMVEGYGRDFVPMDGNIPFPFTGYTPEQITTTVDVKAHIEAKIAGIRCHVSQIDPTMPVIQAGYDHATDPFLTQENFILAHSTIPVELPETDLFAGLRSE